MRVSAELRHMMARRLRNVGLLRTIRKAMKTPADLVEFENSSQYWKDRYENGGDSGEGSYGPLARYKATFINDFSRANGINSAVEFGCGDGNQSSMFQFSHYLGVDISRKCVEDARKRFDRRGWSFLTVDEYDLQDTVTADLGMSLDVIYHLVEDEVYRAYLSRIFSSSRRYVLIYASNFEHFDANLPHVRHRKFVDDIRQRHSDWRFVGDEPNPFAKNHDSEREYGSFARFHIFEKCL
jgi:cyclopropane fatty-acyl-phospholipid synthase-like methyltransferase